MKGKIDKKGILFIERAGESTNMGCPFNSIGVFCSHGCPHFGEPEDARINSIFEGKEVTTPFTKLELCHGKTLVFTEFEDERT